MLAEDLPESLVRFFAMSRLVTADDILPLIACLTPQERFRLLRLVTATPSLASAAYHAIPPAHEEFSTEEEPLSWDAEGWENFG